MKLTGVDGALQTLDGTEESRPVPEPFPHRVRLRGTHGTHAARRRLDIGLITACDRYDAFGDKRLDDAAPITCRACQTTTYEPVAP